MKIAVFSDIHENYHNLVLFFKQVKEMKVEKMIFLGDFINAGIGKILAEFDIPTISIWGNNDGDKVNITKFSMSENSNLEVGDTTYNFLEIDNRKIFITHYPDLVNSMIKSGDFDAVFYGHTHNKYKDKINNCLVLNPGEITSYKTGISSFAVYDTKNNDAEIFEIKGAISTKTPESRKFLDELRIYKNN